MLRARAFSTPCESTNTPLQASSYIDTNTCEAQARPRREMLSTITTKGAKPQIITGQHKDQSTQRRIYVQPAIYCQPSYCWWTSESKSPAARTSYLKTRCPRIPPQEGVPQVLSSDACRITNLRCTTQGAKRVQIIYPYRATQRPINPAPSLATSRKLPTAETR